MDSESSIKVLAAVRAAWPYQPMDDREQREWLRALSNTVTRITVEEARAALDRLVISGGSRSASQPGRRPGVAEFVGAVTAARARRPAVPDTRNPEPLPDVSPDDVRRHLAAIRSAVGLRSAARA
jgi:hypothetical protein